MWSNRHVMRLLKMECSNVVQHLAWRESRRSYQTETSPHKLTLPILIIHGYFCDTQKYLTAVDNFFEQEDMRKLRFLLHFGNGGKTFMHHKFLATIIQAYLCYSMPINGREVNM